MIRALVLSFAIAAAAYSPLSAAPMKVSATYEISLAGWGLARANLNFTMQDGKYEADLFMKPKGVARVVTAVRTSVSAAGRVRRGVVQPSRYAVRADEIDRPVAVDMKLNAGTVSSLRATPPLKKRPDRVSVTNAHRRNIVDPISSGLLPINSADGRDACDNTMKIFDGWTRYDVRWSYAGTERVQTKGYSGRAIVCNARWVPVAGHRRNKKEVQYLARNKRLKMWVIPLPAERVAIPYKVSIGTPNGTILIAPSSMQISGAGV